jgi:hypothetical protein
MKTDAEYLATELAWIVGARIVAVRVEKGALGDPALEIVIAKRPRGNGEQYRATLQVWRDEEGNGPGWLAVTEYTNTKNRM